MTTPSQADRIGTDVAGRYRVTGVLGSGAMGTVYRADHIDSGRPVALKILRAHLAADQEATARFQLEGMVGGRLIHPNCVGVDEVGRCDDGAIFLAMEVLDGGSLGELLAREGPLPWPRALHIARHVLAGLGHAHAKGIVHRDIKPDNIHLCPRDGDADFARVLDFGIAKLVGGAGPAITQAGLTVGTPDYLSPEQATGGAIDGRSDLYSVSAVLFEMLSGVTPFADPDLMTILMGHASRPPPRFAEVAPAVSVPPAVEALVRDGLAKQPDDRVASAEAYMARIDELLAAAPAPEADVAEPVEADVAEPAAPAAEADVAEPAAPPVAAARDGAAGDGEIGSVLDGCYRLDSLLGRGAMGQVYRATRLGLGRAVAVKLLSAALVGDDDARRRFEREAQTAGQLRHPNCVAVTDFGVTPAGSRYLIMELAEGTSLADVLAGHDRLPVARAVHIARHLLRGLAHAHELGIVHRDLKPGNIMLVRNGDDPDFARILDFGLARMMAGDDRVTAAGVAAGTPTYMAPEQILDRRFDARADLYALSVILFEMLAGRPPYQSEEITGVLKMHLSAPVPRIADVAPGVVVPAALDELIGRGLAKSAGDRPATAEAYLAELERASPAAAATMELSALDSAILPVVVPPPTPTPTPTPAAPPVAAPPVAPPPAPRVAASPPDPASVVRPPAPPSGWPGRRPTGRQLALGGAALLLIGIVAAIASSGGSSSRSKPGSAPAPLSEHDIELDADSTRPLDRDVAEALALARSGRGEAAVSRLRQLRRQRPDDASIPYVMGRVYARLNWPRQTVEAYQDAIRLDGSLREDAQLIRDLVELLDSRSSWQDAAHAIEHDVGPPAIDALTATAANHRSSTVRNRAARLRDRLSRR